MLNSDESSHFLIACGIGPGHCGSNVKSLVLVAERVESIFGAELVIRIEKREGSRGKIDCGIVHISLGNFIKFLLSDSRFPCSPGIIRFYA